MTSPRILAALLLLGPGFIDCAAAGTAPSPAPSATTAAAPTAATGIFTGNLAQGSLYDRIWSVPLLYKNPENPYLQELAIQGQLQAQYAYGSEDRGQYSSGDMPEANRWGDVEVRRWRLGLRATLFKNLKFHSLLDIDPDFSPHFYKDIAETYLTYAPCDAFNLSVGKTELKFTREQEVSSREILNFERSQLVNLFYGGELSGAWVSGKNIAGGWLYELGAYNNERVDEWTSFSGGTILLAKIGYNYSKRAGFDYAQTELHYLHNSEPGHVPSAGCASSPAFSNCLALSNDLTQGRFSLATEGFWGDGYNRANVGGLTVMPAWFLTEKLQAVTTFQIATGNEDNAIPLPTRYEQQVPDGKSIKGDCYFAGYAGLNYYFYGHKLKVMSGAKYTNLSGGDEDFNGWTWLLGARTCF